LRQELEWSKQDVLRTKGKGTVIQAATALGTSPQNAWRWMGPDSPQPQFLTGRGAVHERLRRRCRELLTAALGRTQGSVPQAAELLGVPQMTARRWARALVPELLRDTRRNPNVSTTEILRLRETGLTAYAIAKQLGVSKSLVTWRVQQAESRAA
jgi:predicted ArsR family transcriptional regulator